MASSPAPQPTLSRAQKSAQSLLQQLVFLPWVQYPPLPRVPDLSDPSKFNWTQEDDKEEFDTAGISHLYISTPLGTKDSTSRLGAWYMLPTKSSGKVEQLTTSDTLVLYLHGNASNRSMPHRIALYRILLSLGYYVLAVDYRGFGDSSPVVLNEDTVVADARAALGWVTSKLGDSAKVVVWGHSLGTAIASHMVADYDMETGGNSPVCGLILESPFNNMIEEVNTYKLSTLLVSKIFDLGSLIEDTGVAFETDKWLPAVRCPVLILHAEDDNVVPHSLGQALHQAGKAAGKDNIRMVSYPPSLGLSHCKIHQAEGLVTEIKEFVTKLEGQEERVARLG